MEALVYCIIDIVTSDRMHSFVWGAEAMTVDVFIFFLSKVSSLSSSLIAQDSVLYLEIYGSINLFVIL